MNTNHTTQIDAHATAALACLGADFTDTLPAALMVGSGRATRDAVFLELIASGGWSEFLTHRGMAQSDQLDAAFIPVAAPSLMTHAACKEVPGLAAALRGGVGRYDWDDFWDGFFAESAGCPGGSLKDVNRFLVKRDARVIFLCGGFEDAFGDPGEGSARDAVESLVKTPYRIAELSDCRIGMVAVVSREWMRAAIRQNLGRCLYRFRRYSLTQQQLFPSLKGGAFHCTRTNPMRKYRTGYFAARPKQRIVHHMEAMGNLKELT